MQEVYFLERALDPYVALSIGDRETVLTRNTAVLLIPDGAAPSAADREEIAKWIERGGIAVRFAGPNLATGNDPLVPTPLRLGDRALGGVMSWGQPTALAEFPANSPFLGIPIPKDVRISQQVLAEPTPDLADKTWARLTDGTPLVTAEKRGQGYLVLIHTTANTGWSNMSLSRPVREHAAAAGHAVARCRRRRRQPGAEAVAHPGRLRPPGRAAGRRADAAGRRQRDLQAQADHAARPLRRRERPGRLQHRRPCRRAQAAGAAVRRQHRQALGRRRDRPVALVPAGRAPAAAGRPLHLAVAARAFGPRRALRAQDGRRRDGRPAALRRGLLRLAAARQRGRPGGQARTAAAQRGAGAEGRARHPAAPTS